MMLDLSRIDCLDASKCDSAIMCYRHPEPLYIEKEGAVFNMFNIRNGKIDRNTKPITLPLMVLDRFFKKWPGVKQISNTKGIYFREPGPCHAVRIEIGEKRISTTIGNTICEVEDGDYIITRESGLNEICKKSDFEITFITSMSNLRDPIGEINIAQNNEPSIR